MLICGNCGQQLHDRAVFCDNCGFRLGRPEVVIPAGIREQRIALQQREEKKTLMGNMIFSALAVLVLSCLFMKWLIVNMAYDPSTVYNRYTLLQLSNSMNTALVASAPAVFLANLLKFVTILNSILWAIFLWSTITQSDLKRIFSNLAGGVTIIMVIAISVFVTIVNSYGYNMLDIPQRYGQASLSVAPFLAAMASIVLMVTVSIHYQDAKRRRDADSESGSGSKVFSFENVDPEVVLSTLVDLNTLIIAGTKPNQTLAANVTSGTYSPAATVNSAHNSGRYEGLVYENGGEKQGEAKVKQEVGSKNISEAVLRAGDSFTGRVCPDCGGSLAEQDAFCGNCGSIF